MSGPSAPSHQRVVRALIDHELAQPTAVSCGAAAIAFGRAVRDDQYARHLAGSCPSLGAPKPCRVASTFSEEVVRLHRASTSLRGDNAAMRSGVQLPWPRALGTPPWAMARALGTPTQRYGVRWATSELAWSRARRALSEGLPVGLFVGTLWLPRHVTLLLPEGWGLPDADLTAYNPATGKVRPLTGGSVASAEFRVATSWPQPWWLVVPR